MDKLKLNPDKTEFIILGTRQQLEKVKISHLIAGETRISPSMNRSKRPGMMV